MKYLILLSLFLVACGKSENTYREKIISCFNSYNENYMIWASCSTESGDFSLDLDQMFIQIPEEKFMNIQPGKFFEINERGGLWYITANVCTNSRNCELRTVCGNYLNIYTKTLE